MRITAGSMRGRTLRVPEIEGLRPTPSRVREAVFNIWRELRDTTVLDLFSGSGIMSLEALSRGAKTAQSIESDVEAYQAMCTLQKTWAVEGWVVRQGILPKALPTDVHFDFIYADPPYGRGLAEQVPIWLHKNGITFETLVIEEASRTKLEWKAGYLPDKSRKYSETTLYFFQPNIEVAR